MSNRTAVIHIGLHKTAATSLQAYLGSRTAWLRSLGVVYPHAGRSPRHAPAHHNIAWELSGDPRFSPHHGTIEDLREELTGHDGNALMSSEDFTMAAYHRRAFADFLRVLQADGFDVVLVVFLANQASSAISMYKTFLGMGYDINFGTFLAAICDRGEVRFRQWVIPYRYDRLLEAMQTLPAQLRVCSYDEARRHDSLLATFLDACGIDPGKTGGHELPWEDIGPDLRESLGRFHRNAIGPVTSSLSALFERAEQVLPGGGSYRSDERARLEACFGESNTEICSRWGIELDPIVPPGLEPDLPLSSMSDLFSLEFHRIVSASGATDGARPGAGRQPANWLGGFHARLMRPVLQRLARTHRGLLKRLHRRLVMRDWQKTVARIEGDNSWPSRPVRRLVILPSYPADVFGSKGDEAMITSAIQAIADRVPELEVGLLVSPGSRDEGVLRERGWQLLRLDGMRLDAVTRAFEAFDADGCIVIGADIMDGFYSPAQTTFSLAVADLAARRGMKSAITGFSFNATPDPTLKDAFRRLASEVAVNVRDPVSLGRFRAFSPTPARLVADVAFLLRPAESSPRIGSTREWVRHRRGVGDVILGVNVHPALFEAATVQQITRINEAMTTALGVMLRRHALSVVLLTHDHRDEMAPSDEHCLAAIESGLRRDADSRVCRPAGRMPAAELKAVAGMLDGVFTARMHLAIAALGMGVPVAAITYQDKFEGLFAMFDIPAGLLATPEVFDTPDRLLATMERFLAELAESRSGVHRALANVRRAAQANLELFLPAGCGSGRDFGERHTASDGWGSQ